MAALLPCCMVRPETLTFMPLLIVNAVTALLPSTANELAPGPAIVRLLAIVNVPPVSVIVAGSATLNPIVSAALATVIASRSVQVDEQLPGPLSAVELTVIVAACAGRGVASSGRQTRVSRISSEIDGTNRRYCQRRMRHSLLS